MKVRVKVPANVRTLSLWIAPLIALGLFGACSSGPEVKHSDPGAPTILTARSQPGTIELNRDLQPIQSPVIQADIHDFKSQVTEVTLEFANVPIIVEMTRLKGDTWQAHLDSRALEMMAVSGQTIKYGARIIAKNADGKTAFSENPVEISIKAPQLARASNI